MKCCKNKIKNLIDYIYINCNNDISRPSIVIIGLICITINIQHLINLYDTPSAENPFIVFNEITLVWIRYILNLFLISLGYIFLLLIEHIFKRIRVSQNTIKTYTWKILYLISVINIVPLIVLSPVSFIFIIVCLWLGVYS